MGEYIQVFTTAETQDDAQRIARAVVEKRLAGCAQVIGPIASTYWWEGAVETSGEWLCVIKSKREAYDRLEQAIRGARDPGRPRGGGQPELPGLAG
jgi:periplasmic divalent cation tolerance protein